MFHPQFTRTSKHDIESHIHAYTLEVFKVSKVRSLIFFFFLSGTKLIDEEVTYSFNFAFDSKAGDIRCSGEERQKFLPSPPPLKFPPRPYNKFPALLVDKGYKRGGNYADKMLVQSEQNGRTIATHDSTIHPRLKIHSINQRFGTNGLDRSY